MKKELQELLIQRYKYLLIAIAVFFIGLSFLETKNNISNWKDIQIEVTDKNAEKNFYKEIKDKNSYPDGKMTLYYDVDNGDKVIATDNFEEYKENRLKVFPDKKDQQSVFGFYLTESISLLISVTVISGFALFFYDNKTNFNTLLFSSKFSKQAIYLAKYKIVGGTFLLTLAIAKLVRMLGLVLFIPKEYLNVSFLELLPSQILQISCLMTIFVVSSFAGLILGDWITGIVTMLGFWYMLSGFIYGLNSIYVTLMNKEFKNVPGFEIVNYFELSKKSVSEILLPILVFLIISIILLLWGNQLYKQLSLENNGNYLMFNHLKKPVQIIFLLFVFVVTRGGALIEALKIKLTGINPYGQYQPSVAHSLLITLLVLVVAYLVSTIIIYRKNPLKMLTKLKR